MATHMTDIHIERPGLKARIGAGFERIFAALVAMADSNPRMKAIKRLNALSDEELAGRGLKREDLVRHIFRDVYYS